MIPPLIIQQALEIGLDLLAITDHNASANIPAVMEAAKGTNLVVLPGMEIQTREDVHNLCLFDTLDQIDEFQRWVDQSLPNLENHPDFFGEQFVVDSTGDYIRSETRLLATAVNVSLDVTWKQVISLGGMMIPAHVNRKLYGLINSLGFVPPHIPFDALELSRHLHPSQAVKSLPMLAGYSLIQNGDVHRLDEFLGALQLRLELPTISEIRKAFHNQDGRQFSILNVPN